MTTRFEEFKIEIRKEMMEFKTKLEDELRKELNDMKESLDFQNAKFEDAKKRNEELEKQNAELKKANESLSNDCLSAKKQLQDLEQRMTANEQYSRKYNIEIKGVEKEENEDLMKVVCQVGTTLNEPVTPSDIEICHRVKPREESACPNIVVQFRNRSKREALLQKARKARLSNKDLGFSTNTPVYVNEQLCPALKKLLGITVAKKKACGWKFAWTRDGRIFARRDEGSTVLHVRNERDVDFIV